MKDVDWFLRDKIGYEGIYIFDFYLFDYYENVQIIYFCFKG